MQPDTETKMKFALNLMELWNGMNTSGNNCYSAESYIQQFSNFCTAIRNEIKGFEKINQVVKSVDG